MSDEIKTQEKEIRKESFQSRNQHKTQYLNTFLDKHILQNIQTDQNASISEMEKENKQITVWMEKWQKKTGSLTYEGWAVNREKLNQNRIRILSKDTKWYGKDSPEMQKVKKSLADIEEYLHTEIASGDVYKEFEKAQKLYDKAIEDCSYYMWNKSPMFSAGKRRYKKVKEIAEQLKKEKERLISGYSVYGRMNSLIKEGKVTGVKTLEAKTLKDLLEIEVADHQYNDVLRQKKSFMDIEDTSYNKAGELCGDYTIINDLKAIRRKKNPKRYVSISDSFNKRAQLDIQTAKKNSEKDNQEESEIQKYYKSMAELAEETDAIEQEQYEYIKNKTNEETAKKWLDFVDKEHERCEKTRRAACLQSMTPEEYMFHRGEDNHYRMEYLVLPQWKEENFKNCKYEIGNGDRSRFLDCFIRPVKRDASGHFVSAKDRANHAFNQKLRDAILNGKSEILKEIGKEFVDRIRNYPEPPAPKLSKDGKPIISEAELLRHVDYYENMKTFELNLFSNVVKKRKTNSIIPELGEGMAQLEEGEYKLLETKYRVRYVYFLDYFYRSKGYDYTNGFINDQEAKKNANMLPAMLEIWQTSSDEYKKAKEESNTSGS